MSQASGHDAELLELSCHFRDLRVTVRGPPDQVSEVVSALSSHFASRESTSSAASVESYELVEPSPASIAPSAPLPSVSASSVSSAGLRDSIAAGFPPWVAENQITTPNRSVQLDLRPRFYAVLRAEDSSGPFLCLSATTYWRLVGRIQDNDRLPLRTGGQGILCRSFGSRLPEAAMMVSELEQMDGVDPTALVLASQELHPYVLRLGSPDDTDGVLEVLAIVVLKRSGAFLLAIPDGRNFGGRSKWRCGQRLWPLYYNRGTGSGPRVRCRVSHRHKLEGGLGRLPRTTDGIYEASFRRRWHGLGFRCGRPLCSSSPRSLGFSSHQLGVFGRNRRPSSILLSRQWNSG